jgi:hypothetical protein
MADYPGGSYPPSGNPPSGNPPSGNPPSGNSGGQGGSPPPSYGHHPHGSYGQPGAPQYFGGGYPGAASPPIAFDLRTIAPGGLTAVVGALLYFVFSFFPWYTIYFCPFGPDTGSPCGVSLNAWDRGSAVSSVLMFLLVALAFVVKAFKVLPPKFPLEVIALSIVVLGDISFLVAFFSTEDGLSRGWGLWVDLVLALVINLGVLLQFVKVGGVVSARRGLSNMQQRASGPPGYGPPGGYPPPPGYQQGGYPTGGPPQQGGYPPSGYPPYGGGHPQQPGDGGYPPQGGGR